MSLPSGPYSPPSNAPEAETATSHQWKSVCPPSKPRVFRHARRFRQLPPLGPVDCSSSTDAPRIERRLADFREEESPVRHFGIASSAGWHGLSRRAACHRTRGLARPRMSRTVPEGPKWDSLRPCCWPVGMICMLAGACTFLRKRASPRRHERPSVSGKVHESQAIIAKAASNCSCSFVTKAIMIRASSRT